MKKINLLLLVLSLSFLASCNKTASPDGADAIYYNGKILTMEGNTPVYVEALAVKNDTIMFVGTLAEAEKLKGPGTKMEDLGGRTMLPGFIDGHSHYINSVLVANQCMLYPAPSGKANSVKDIISELKKFVADNNIQPDSTTLIMGYGYDHTCMVDNVTLTREDLDREFPHNPVRIDHVSMHGCVLNSLGMEKYNIKDSDPTPDGGTIERKDGKISGLIMESAYLPIISALDPMTPEEEAEGTKKGQMMYASEGITTAQEGSTHFPQFKLIKNNSEKGHNIIDVVSYPFLLDVDSVLGIAKLDDWLKYNKGFKLGGVKITIDGSPQGRTAFFTTPYLPLNPPGNEPSKWAGQLLCSQDSLNMFIKAVYEMDLKVSGKHMPLLVHCNGDAAIDAFIKAYKFARAGNYSDPWNVTCIHAQFLRDDQIDSLVKYNIRPSFYTLHTFYFYMAHKANRGEQAANFISPMRAAIDKGLKPTNHTDFVVAPLSQMMVVYSAVTRLFKDDVTVAGEGQRITPYEALQAITINGAAQYDEEATKGSLTKGKKADLVILSANPLEGDPKNIKNIVVLKTIKSGKTIYDKEKP